MHFCLPGQSTPSTSIGKRESQFRLSSSFYTIATKTDAKNQQVQYTYDSYKRVTQIRRYTFGGGTYNEDTCQRTDYTYDSNPYDGAFSQYVAGRLAAVQYKMTRELGLCTSTVTEMYSYNQGGRILKKRFRLTRTGQADLDSTYTYDNEGRMTSVAYPLSGPQYTMSYDSMGRAGTLTDQTSATIASATYGTASELLSLNGQSFTYNTLFQLTRIQGGGIDISYNYSATQNNGKITSQTDNISGEQVVYTYDSLQRLSLAETVTNPSVTQWGQSYGYDGWGNLLSQTVTKGSAPTYSVVADPATNRVGSIFDANGNDIAGGNSSFDVENRLLIANGFFSPVYYGYARQ